MKNRQEDLQKVIPLEIVAESWGIPLEKGETPKSVAKRIGAAMAGREIPKPVLEQKRPARWWLTFLWTWQADLFSFIATLLIRLMWGKSLFWKDGLWAELKRDCWPKRTWYKDWGGTTFCHGGMISAGRMDILPHELHHVEQAEARMLAGFVVGLASASIAYLFGSSLLHIAIALEVPWFSSWFLGYLSGLIQAYIRGEEPYKGSYLEEAAYALTRKHDELSSQ